MQLQLIRSATMRFNYNLCHFLTDPYLSPRHALPSYTGKSPNPLVDLPVSTEAVLRGIEMTIISHLHSDHFDPLGAELLSKDLPILCQPGDVERLAAKGFTNLHPVEDSLEWQGITFTRIPGRHGTGSVLDQMGHTSGFVFQTPHEPTVYWVGDSNWYETVAEAISRFDPDIIITHSNGAVWGEHVQIVMDEAQTLALCEAAPRSTVVAVHMEALDHGTVSRAQLRQAADARGIGPERLLIPNDGEKLAFS